MSTIKRKDLANKLTPADAIIQAGLDSGWSCFFTSGNDKLEQLTESERDYLHKSATSYMMAGDPTLTSRANQYVKTN